MPTRLLPAAFCAAALAWPQSDVHLKSASTHPMQYYLSLPRGWTAQKKWLVVVRSHHWSEPTDHYSEAVWNRAEALGRCRFDMDGIAAAERAGIF